MSWAAKEVYDTAERGDAWFMRQWVPKLTSTDINHSRTNPDRNTALIIAAKLGHLECVQILLTHPHIDTCLQNKCGVTAVVAAEKAGHKMVVEAIVTHIVHSTFRYRIHSKQS